MYSGEFGVVGRREELWCIAGSVVLWGGEWSCGVKRRV